jgi:hypothetical protein
MRRRHATRAALIAALAALAIMTGTALAGIDDARDTEPVEVALPTPPGAPPRQDKICARLDAILRDAADSPERRTAAATRDALHCSTAAGSRQPPRTRPGDATE